MTAGSFEARAGYPARSIQPGTKPECHQDALARSPYGVGTDAAGGSVVPEGRSDFLAVVPQDGPIPHVEFSTDNVSGADQFDIWRHNFAPMLDLTPIADTPAAMDGRQVIWDLGCLAFTSISTEALNFASLPAHARRTRSITG